MIHETIHNLEFQLKQAQQDRDALVKRLDNKRRHIAKLKEKIYQAYKELYAQRKKEEQDSDQNR